MSYIDTVTGCQGKHGYPTYSEAAKVVKRNRNKVFIAPYRCPNCTLFHIGKHFGRKCIANRNWRVARQGDQDE